MQAKIKQLEEEVEHHAERKLPAKVNREQIKILQINGTDF